LFGKASGRKALLPDPLNALPYLTGFGDKSFVELIKERLGFGAKGCKIHATDDDYQLREGQTGYGADSENTFYWD
jgi:hypothetical protein